MANDGPTYAFSDSLVGGRAKQHHTRRPRRHSKGKEDSSDQNTSDENSLTYSAGSSVNSGGSAAGESTDSSFADIMKVLDLQDRDELAALMKKEGLGEYRKALQAKSQAGGSNNTPASSSALSVASSLAYSTDQESALESALGGEALLQTITGQPSDGYGPDGGGMSGDPDAFDGDNIVFAPAEPFDKKKKKKHSRKDSKSSSSSDVKPQRDPKSNGPRPKKEPESIPAPPQASPVYESPRLEKNAHDREETSSGGSNSTPAPRSPIPRSTPRKKVIEDNEVWWGKWWMCGFSDAFRDLAPKF